MRQIYENENSNKFTAIFSENWERFLLAYPDYDNPHVNRQIQLMMNCSDPQFGFKQYMCTDCGLDSKVVANSCKSKFCLRCGRVDGENFSKNIADKLHDGVDHRHLVLTIPPQFRKVFYKNRHNSDLFNVFYAAGWKFVNKLMEKIFGEEVECGCLIVLHTVGRKCDYKPHLHVLLMSGGISASGEWVVLKNFYYGIIQRLWQEVLLSAIGEWDKKGYLTELCDFLERRYPKGFVGNISEKKAPKARKALLRYLGKYLCKPQISIKRIISYDLQKDEVIYRYKSHETGKSEVERVDILTFIGRMVQQILPKGFKRVRYFGLQAAKNISRLTAKVCSALGKLNFSQEIENRTAKSVKATYQEFVEAVWGEDPFLCSKCGSKMELVRVWKPGKGFVFNVFEHLWGKDIGPVGILPEFLINPSG